MLAYQDVNSSTVSMASYSDYIYSLYMGTCERDIKDAYEQLIPKTLKELLTKQTKIMFYSNNLMS